MDSGQYVEKTVRQTVRRCWQVVKKAGLFLRLLYKMNPTLLSSVQDNADKEILFFFLLDLHGVERSASDSSLISEEFLL